MNPLPPLQLRTVVVAVGIAISLSACGGGSKGGTRKDNPGAGVPTKPVNPHAAPSARNASRIFVENGATVLVSVADSAVNAEHRELVGQIADARPRNSGEPPFATGDAANHGTAVAARIAGNQLGFAGNAKLLVSQVGTGLFSGAAVRESHLWALDRGARVLNASYGTGSAPIARYREVFDRVAATGAFVAWGAGNRSENMSELFTRDGAFISGSPFGAEGGFASPYLIFVGAVTPSGTRWSDSNFPGDSPEVQSRFLSAPGANVSIANGSGGYWTGNGTSWAAPVVSAGAASIMSLWPHMSGDQVASLLLGTADKSSALYQRNDCGAAGNVNCGAYWLGQGVLDMTAAMTPQGDLVVPQGAFVGGPGAAVTESTMRLASSFGDAARAFEGVELAAFDELGRDYGVAVSALVKDSSARSGVFGASMNALVHGQAARTLMPEQHAAFDGMNVSMQYATDGSVLRMNASANLANGGEWSAFSYSGQEQHAVSDVDALRALGLLSMYDSDRPESSRPYQSGLSLSVPLGARMNLGTTHWVAHGFNALDADDRGRASGSRVALAFNALDSLNLSLGAGVSRESDTVLGSIGRGAMALGGADNRTLSLGIDYKATDALRVFVRHQEGRLNVSSGGAMVRALSGARTSETAFGATYTGEGWTAAAVVSSPLRVSGASAQLSVPTGRTLDGQVVSTTHRVSFSPSGRQRNAEIAFARVASDGSTVGVNLLHVTEPGHVRGVSSEYAAMAHWVKAF